MAYTVTKTDKQSVGAKFAVTLEVTADAATQTVASTDTGLSIIDYFSIGIQSAASSAFSVKPNLDASGAASNGALGISGAASGDVFFITCFGR